MFCEIVLTPIPSQNLVELGKNRFPFFFLKPVFHWAEYSARSGKPIVFHRIPPKAYAEKSNQV